MSAPLSRKSLIFSVAASGKRHIISAAAALSITQQTEKPPKSAAAAKNTIERVKVTPIPRLERALKSPAVSAEKAYAPIKNKLFSRLIPKAKPRPKAIIRL